MVMVEKLNDRPEVNEQLARKAGAIATFMGGDYNMTVGVGPEGSGWHWDFDRNHVNMDAHDLMYEPEEIVKGVACHEGNHRAASRAEHVQDMWREPGFSFGFNAVEDPRANQAGMHFRPGSRDWIKAYIERDLGSGGGLNYLEIPEDVKKKIGYIPAHMKWGAEMIRYWHAKELADEKLAATEEDKQTFLGAIPDQDVRDAVSTTLGDFERYYRTIPDTRDEVEVQRKAEQSADTFKQKIWPVYKKLVEQAYDEQAVVDMIKDMVQAAGGEPGTVIAIPFSALPQDVQDEIRQKMQNQQQGGESSETQGQASQNNQSASPESGESASEASSGSSSGQQGDEQQSGNTAGQTGSASGSSSDQGSEQTDSNGNMQGNGTSSNANDANEGDASPSQGGGSAGSESTQSGNEQSEGKQQTSGQSSESGPQSSEVGNQDATQSQPSPQQDATEAGDKPNEQPQQIPWDKLSDKAKEAAKQAFSDLEKEIQDQYREQAQQELEGAEDEANEKLRGKMNNPRENETHKEQKEREQQEAESEQQAEAAQKQAQEDRRQQEEAKRTLQDMRKQTERAMRSTPKNSYQEYLNDGEVKTAMVRLDSEFRRIFTPNEVPGQRYSYSGLRPAMSRAMQFEADPRKSNIFEVKGRPSEKSHRFLWSGDLSGSMAGIIDLLFKAVVINVELANKHGLETAVIGFSTGMGSQGIEVFKDFEPKKLDRNGREKLGNMPHSGGGGTPLYHATEVGYTMLKQRNMKAHMKSNYFQTFTDGGPTDASPQDLAQLVKKIRKDREIITSGFGIGRGTQYVNDIYPEMPKIVREEIAKKIKRPVGDISLSFDDVRDFAQAFVIVMRYQVEHPELFYD